MMEDVVLTATAEAALAKTATAAPLHGATLAPEDEALLAQALSSLDENKAEDVVSIDLRGRSEIADHIVIASGRSTRQVVALAEKLTETVKSRYGITCKVEGKEHGDWVLIDAGDVIVHIFRPEVREFYQLEKMWMPAGTPTV